MELIVSILFFFFTPRPATFSHTQTGSVLVCRSCDCASGNLNKTSVREKSKGVYLPIGGEGRRGALVSCSTSTPINHIVVVLFFFFWQNTSCIRKPQVISGGGAHPLHPPSTSAPDLSCDVSLNQAAGSLNLKICRLK